MVKPLLTPELMHAPDGLFAVWLSVLGWLIVAVVIYLAVRHTETQLGERQVPLMGIVAATIFAGQMLNFTVLGGTSGHLLGGALAAIILGPWGAVLVMTAVIAVQALIFQDGGLIVMGLNIVNMGIITSFVGYFSYRAITRIVKGKPGIIAGAAMGGWLSVVLTSALTAVELSLSGSSPLAIALPSMVGVHGLIGLGEAALTAFALLFVLATRTDLVTGESAPGQRSAAWIMAGLLVAFALTLLAPLASPYADGMESVTQKLGMVGESSPYSILPDYTIPLLGNSGPGTIVAGLIGVLVVFAAAYSLAWITRRQRRQDEPGQSAS